MLIYAWLQNTLLLTKIFDLSDAYQVAMVMVNSHIAIASIDNLSWFWSSSSKIR